MRARAGSGGVLGRRRRGHGQLLRGRRVERAHTQTHTGVGFGRRCFLAYLFIIITPGRGKRLRLFQSRIARPARGDATSFDADTDTMGQKLGLVPTPRGSEMATRVRRLGGRGPG
jgi:hypothetical protein